MSELAGLEVGRAEAATDGLRASAILAPVSVELLARCDAAVTGILRASEAVPATSRPPPR